MKANAWHNQEFAYYEGDELLGVGTAKELAKRFNVKPETIKFYASPAHQRRMANVGWKTGRRKYTIRIEADL